MSILSMFKLNSIFMRLLLAFWLLSAGILIIGGLYINQTVESEFADLITDTRQQELEEINRSLADILQTSETERSVQISLHHLARTHNERLIVKDRSGDIIMDSGEGHMGPGMMNEMPRGPSRENGMGMHNHMSERDADLSPEEFLQDFNEEQIAQNTFSLGEMGIEGVQVTILPTDRKEGLYNPRELDFTAQVTRNIAFAGIIALITSAVISLFLSLSISKPLNHLKNTVSVLHQGNLSSRAQVQGPDELRELALHFNSMADRLESADYLKKKLTQDLSHELNNPVASLKGYVEAFQDGVLEVNEENLQSTNQEIVRLEDLSQELHQLAKADFRGQNVNFKQLDLSEFGEKVWKSAWSQGFLYDIEVSYEGPERELFIKVDEELLYAAVNNLVRNAVKHTTQNGSISIQVYEDSGNGVIAISDTGSGIPSVELANIFERFYRIDSLRTKLDHSDMQKNNTSQGSGIGLSLVKEWTETMSGKVEVASTPGVGSTFKLIFPMIN